MSSNTPYNDDSSVLSSIIMTGILGAGATAGVMAYTNPEKLSKIFNRAVDFVTPKSHEGLSSIQSDVLNSNKTFYSTITLAKRRKEATYADRTERAKEVIAEISQKGEIRPLNVDQEGLTKVLGKMEHVEGHHLASLKASKFEDIQGGQEVLDMMNRVHGTSVTPDQVKLNGTTFDFPLSNGEFQNVPTTMYHKPTKSWVHVKDGQYKVAGHTGDYTIHGDKLGVNLLKPNTILAQADKDIGGIGMADGLVQINDYHMVRDSLERGRGQRRGGNGDASEREARRAVDKMRSQIEADNLHTSLRDKRSMDKYLKTLEEGYQPVTGTSQAEIQLQGARVNTRTSNKIFIENNSNGLRDGFAEPVVSLGDNASNFGQGTPKVSPEGISSRFQAIADAREGRTPLTLEGASIPMTSARRRNLGWSLGQGQTGEGTFSSAGFMGISPYVDSNKSLTKPYSFTNNVAEVQFDRNPNRKVEASLAYRNKLRGQPLIWSNSVEEAAPHLYAGYKNNRMMNVLSILGDKNMEESIRTDPRIVDSMKIEKDFHVSMKKVVAGDGLPTESQVKVKYNIMEGGKLKSYHDKTFGELFENYDLLGKVHSIEGTPRTILGFGNGDGLVTNTETLKDVLGAPISVVKSSLNWRMDQRHIKQTLEHLRENPEGDFKMFAAQLEHATKTGGAIGQTRSALERATESDVKEMKRLGGKFNMLISPEQIDSPQLYDKMLTRLKGGLTMSGKNRPEMISFLQQSIAGHLALGQETVLEGGMKDKFARLLTDPSKFDGKLNLESLQFDQRVGINSEDISTMVKVLGKQREEFGKGKVTIGDKYSYETAAETLSKDLNSYDPTAKPWLMWNSHVAHEGQQAQGIGQNIYQMGLNDSMQFVPNSWVKELGVKNLADTGQINTDVNLMLNSFKKDISPDLKKLGIETLDKEGLDKMMGNLTMTSDISDPYVFKDTFMSHDVNPNGFAIKGHDGRSIAFGSDATYGGGQYLHEEGKLAIQANTRAEIRALKAAQENGGVLPIQAERDLNIHRKTNYSKTGTGPLKQGAIHVEGTEYGINLAEGHWLNNDSIWDKVSNASKTSETAEEFKNLFGNIGVLDEGTYQNNIFKELDSAIITAKKNSTTAAKVLEEQYGPNHFLSQFMEGKSLNSSADALEIAKETTKTMMGYGDELQNGVMDLAKDMSDSKMKKLSTLIKERGQQFLGDRFPHEGLASTSYGYLFPSKLNSADGGKSLSLGRIMRTNMNADNDGDKIFVMLGNVVEQRYENLKKIMGTQKIAAEYMTMFKKKSLLSASTGLDKGSYHFPSRGDLDSLVGAMKETEVESAISAFITKGMTGSANYRAHEIQNELMNDILKNKKLAGDTLEHAKAFAYALPGQNIVQSIISSKGTEAIIKNGQESAFHKLHDVISNIGNVSKEQFMQGIVNASGELNPIQLFAAMHGSKANQAKWLSAEEGGETILPQFKTLADMNTSWRRITDRKEFDAFHEIATTKHANADAHWAAYNIEAENIIKNGGFLRDRTAMKEAGFSKFENIFDLYKHYSKEGAGSVTESIERDLALTEKAFRDARRAGDTKITAEEIFMSISDKKYNTSKVMGSGVVIDPRATPDAVAGVERRSLRYMAEIKSAGKQIRTRHVAGALGFGLVAMTALNVLGGDGTPEDPNDLPSVNNPSFGDQKYGNMAQRHVLNSPVSSNMSMGLITGGNDRMDDTLHSVSAMFNGGRYNTVSVRSDGSNPYSADMHKYTN